MCLVDPEFTWSELREIFSGEKVPIYTYFGPLEKKRKQVIKKDLGENLRSLEKSNVVVVEYDELFRDQKNCTLSS